MMRPQKPGTLKGEAGKTTADMWKSPPCSLPSHPRAGGIENELPDLTLQAPLHWDDWSAAR